jgi:hypothetical protein
LVITEAALLFSPQLLLYLLSLVEHLLWGELGRKAEGCIEEGMGAIESPGRSLIERRDAIDMSDGHTDSVYCLAEEHLPITLVAA